MQRILVVEVNWVGDCILTLPIFPALKKKFPLAYLGVMVPPRLRELFEANPYLDAILEFDEKSTHKSIREKIRFIRLLKEKKFNLAIMLHRSFTRTFICMLAGIKERVGYRRFKTSLILTKKVRPKHFLHRAEYYFSLLEANGIKVEDKIPRFFLQEDEKSWAEKFIHDYRKKFRYLVALNPSSNWPLKRWPLQYFVELIDRLSREEVGIFLIGAQKDCRLAEEIEKKSSARVINLCGKTTLRELAALLQKIDVLVSADSGPAHLASSVGTTVVVLFGPTSPQVTAPLGKNVFVLKGEIACRIPCYNLKCKDNLCMKKIRPFQVYEKLKGIFKNVSQHPY